jgi:hypothetical protein
VVSGEDGLTSFDRPGQIVIEISRLPIAEKERARRCARRDRQEVPSDLYREHLVDILSGREPDKALGKELF